MKFPFLLLASVLLIVLGAVRESQANSDDVKLLELPSLTAEELRQVSFSAVIDADYPGRPLRVALHNPFRDKRIRAVVIHLQAKDADGKEHSIDQLVDIDCGALQGVLRLVPVFNPEELSKGSPVLTLKEAHRESDSPEQERYLPDLKTLKSPSLPAEELKQISFTATLNPRDEMPLQLQWHNPFRDRSLHGFVVSVVFKGEDGKELSREFLVDMVCRPLQPVETSLWIVGAAGIAKGSPVFKLKEARRSE